MIGNAIVVTSPNGRKLEGFINGADLLPGSIMEVDPTVPIDEAMRVTYRVATPGADGGDPNGPMIVLDMNMIAGGDADRAYTDGDWGQLWCPNIGDVMNVRVSAPGTGTGDTLAFGALLIVDNGTGNLIATTGSPVSQPFIVHEEETDDLTSTGTLVTAQFSGY